MEHFELNIDTWIGIGILQSVRSPLLFLGETVMFFPPYVMREDGGGN